MDRKPAQSIPQPVRSGLRRLFRFVVTVHLFAGLLSAQTIDAGGTIPAKLERSVTTESATAGDPVVARVDHPLRRNGSVLPAGTRFRGRVDFVQRKSLTDDGWMRLVFNRVEWPDGREISTLAVVSFHPTDPKPVRNSILTAVLLGVAGALIAGRNNRVTGGLGGAIAGLVIAEGVHSGGRDVVLQAGRTIRLLLSDNIPLH